MIPGGSFPELPERAAEIWKQGYADCIVPSGQYSVKLGYFPGPKSKGDKYNKEYGTECEFYADVLTMNGVDPDKIIGEDKSQHTADNARFTRKVLDERGIVLKKAIICCKAFHARRCLMFYQFCFPETEFFVAPVADVQGLNITRENWYRTDLGLARVQGELARLGNQFGPEFEQLKNSFM